MHTLYLIGVDTEHPELLEKSNISRCDYLVISSRFRNQFKLLVKQFSPDKIIALTPLQDAIEQVEKALLQGNVAFFATGDPLCFGIGKTLLKYFKRDQLVIVPALSSIQLACSKFHIPWDDAFLLSLHGKKVKGYLGTILQNDKTVILTDNHNRVDILCQELTAFLSEDDIEKFTVYVAENLGDETERLVEGTLSEIAKKTFGPLCVMILCRKPVPLEKKYTFGLLEEELCHSRGLITKNEVRAAVIHALQIQPNTIFWDVGAGSGSIGVEVSRMQPTVLTYAVEKNEQQHQNILSNKSSFSLQNLQLVTGEAPDALANLPEPDAIFIGGSGGNLKEIISYCSKKLSAGGRLVVTGVLESTCNNGPEYIYNCGLTVTTSRISVTRSSFPKNEQIELNPITIITGEKKLP